MFTSDLVDLDIFPAATIKRALKFTTSPITANSHLLSLPTSAANTLPVVTPIFGTWKILFAKKKKIKKKNKKRVLQNKIIQYYKRHCKLVKAVSFFV